MLTVIIPSYNESSDLLVMCREIEKTFLDYNNVEILVIDDGSTDSKSIGILEQLDKSKFNNLRIIRNYQNVGYGSSLKQGLVLSSNENIAFLDADNSYSVSDLLKLFKVYLEHHADMVVGIRRGKYYRGNFTKIVLRSLLIRLAEYMCRSKIPDINSGIRIIRKNHFFNFRGLMSDRFSFTTSLSLISLQKGFRTIFEPVDYKKRKGKSHVKLISDGFTAVGQILSISMFFNPLRVIFLFFQSTLIVLFLLTLISLATKSLVYIILGVGLSLASMLLVLGLISHLIKDLNHKNHDSR